MIAKTKTTSKRKTAKLAGKTVAKPKARTRRPTGIRSARILPSMVEERRARGGHAAQFAYMKAPGMEYAFDVGDMVEVYCDHEKNSNRVRGWIKGTVVQVDNKLVAVQFRSNVFLTDGWMVPDRILWYPLASDQIRLGTAAKKHSRKGVPNY